MTARKRRPPRTARPAPDPARGPAPGIPPIAPHVRRWFLGAGVALIAARTWFPSESAAEDGSGLPAVMLWIVLALSWAVVGMFGGATFRFGRVDAAVALLVVCAAASALWSVRTAAPRPALNMLWEWIGLGLSYLLLRQWLDGQREARSVLAVMVAMAVAHVANGYYQDRVVLPETQAAYRRDPEAALRLAGIVAPPGSVERKQFEDRLLYSHGVLSTFALTNSLAGFLVPWLIVAAGIGMTAGVLPRGRWLVRIGCVAIALAIAVCLAATFSRSGLLAAMLGLLALAAWRMGLFRYLTGWRCGIAAGLTLVAFGAISWALRNQPQLAGARKSLQYRIEYWQATWDMIRDHPWLGVGPGAFQSWYTRYKLPVALEEIKDPHNFLFEIWATAGTPAVIALMVALMVLAATVLRASRQSPTIFDDVPGDTKRRTSMVARMIDPLCWGATVGAAILGTGLAIMGGYPFSLAVAALVVAPIALAVLHPWIEAGRLSPVLPAIALGAALVNLLAAGGITLPSVAGSVWLLLAVGTSLAEGDRPPLSIPKPAAGALAAAALCLAIGCYWTGYQPVLASQAEMMLAESEPRQVEEHLRRAAELDPLFEEPWHALAGLAFARWENASASDEAALRDFEEAAQRRLALVPLSSRAWLQTGDWHNQMHARTGEPRFAEAAARDYLRAVELYPNDALRQARLAIALGDVADEAGARAARQRALDLDAATPHAEKRLPAELRDLLQRIP